MSLRHAHIIPQPGLSPCSPDGEDQDRKSELVDFAASAFLLLALAVAWCLIHAPLKSWRPWLRFSSHPISTWHRVAIPALHDICHMVPLTFRTVGRP